VRPSARPDQHLPVAGTGPGQRAREGEIGSIEGFAVDTEDVQLRHHLRKRRGRLIANESDQVAHDPIEADLGPVRGAAHNPDVQGLEQRVGEALPAHQLVPGRNERRPLRV